MKKKTNIRTMIRQIVREEVAMAINEVITELKQPSLSSPQVSKPKPQKNIIEKKDYTSNSVLNDVLNETAQSDEWKTMGGGTFDSNKVNDIVGKSYGDMMNSNPEAPVSVDGQQPDFLKKDYRAVMKAIDKKQGKI
tara:strand:+ start:142 stop:549 length:408 start_codon:yes stop_codon:yes gene_type:complete